MWIRAWVTTVMVLVALSRAADRFTDAKTGLGPIDRLILTAITGKAGFSVPTR